MSTQNAGGEILRQRTSVTSRAGGGGVASAAWSPNGDSIATATEGQKVFIWNAKTLAVERQLDAGARGSAGGGAHHAIAFSDDGRYLASGSPVISVWDTGTWQRTRQLLGPGVDPSIPQPIAVHSLAFSPDQHLLIAAYAVYRSGRDQPVIAFRVEDGGVEWTYSQRRTIGYPLIGTSLAVLKSTGELVFATGETNVGVNVDREHFTRIVVLGARTGALARTIDKIHVDAPTALAVSSEGRWIATGTSTGATDRSANLATGQVTVLDNKDPVKIWEAATGRLASEVPVESRVWALAFTPDGKYLVSSQSDVQTHRTLRVWDLKSGRLVQAIQPPTEMGVALDLTFSPDGQELAAAGGNCLTVYEYHPDD